MWKQTTLVAAGALVVVAAAAGCSGDTADHAATSTTAPVSATSSPASDAAAHNDADAMFAHHMIPHHQQAVEMSDIILAKPGIDPRVTELATQIKAAQGPEIEQMRGWLTQWGNPPMPPMASGDTGHGDMGHGEMPAMQGMVAPADITALRNAQGVEAATMFLNQMIGHHEGAITMAQDEIDDGQYPDAVELAHTIVTTQQGEIDTMRGILGTL
ncbi:DUF305 domain-containing protein [Mycobacterium sp. NPDC003449]